MSATEAAGWRALAPAPLRRVRRSALEVLHGSRYGKHWVRRAYHADYDATIPTWTPNALDAAEISGEEHAHRGWRSYVKLDYPAFDLCDGEEPTEQFDAVLCDQVLEHVVDPPAAVRKLFALLRPGGRLSVSTPFLFQVHDCPGDFWRYTPDGMRLMLERAGFIDVDVRSWGNKAAVRRNLGHWPMYRPWHPMRNESDFPVEVWAYARRPLSAAGGVELAE